MGQRFHVNQINSRKCVINSFTGEAKERLYNMLMRELDPELYAAKLKKVEVKK
jgi:hypothetical protein